jgi:N-acetylglucosamine kinase-like BadF-type ATPase
MTRLLGVDGGGTSTVAWLADATGRVLGRGVAGPSNPHAVGDSAARAALDAAIARAHDEARLPRAPADAACLGIAGTARPAERTLLDVWTRDHAWAHRWTLVTDADLVLHAGCPQGWGIAVIAGTGSIAVGRAPDGRTTRAGGWGPLLGDDGSAHDLVLRALRLVARRLDGREPVPSDGPHALAQHLCAASGLAPTTALLDHAARLGRASLAALAPAVVAAARDEPDLAPLLLRPAGLALAEMVAAVACRLQLDPDGLPVALAGSFLRGVPEVERALLEGLRAAGCDPRTTDVPDPVVGALRIARGLLDGPARNAPQVPESTGIPRGARESAPVPELLD